MIAGHWAPLADVLGGLWPGLHPARVPGENSDGWISMGWIFKTSSHRSNEKRAPFSCLGYIGDYTTQLNLDYFINHEIRIPIKKPVYTGK